MNIDGFTRWHFRPMRLDVGGGGVGVAEPRRRPASLRANRDVGSVFAFLSHVCGAAFVAKRINSQTHFRGACRALRRNDPGTVYTEA